mgnify:CR=1 FL=1
MGKDFRKWENGGGKYYHDMGKDVNYSLLLERLYLQNIGGICVDLYVSVFCGFLFDGIELNLAVI